jgi:hypothetical protein
LNQGIDPFRFSSPPIITEKPSSLGGFSFWEVGEIPITQPENVLTRWFR